MTKTPEQMAEEFFENWQPEKPKYIRPKARQYALEKVTECFLAGYQAAQHKDKAVNRTHLAWKLAEDYGAVKWLKHKDPKRFGSTERDYEYTIARDGFYQGYQAAKDQLADADKVMNSPKKLDSWISVKERLPEEGQDCIFYVDFVDKWDSGSEKINFQEIGVFNGKDRFYHRSHTDLNRVTYWMPLPEPPKEEK